MKITAGLSWLTKRRALMHHQYYIPPYAHSSCSLTQKLSHTMPWRALDEISLACFSCLTLLLLNSSSRLFVLQALTTRSQFFFHAVMLPCPTFPCAFILPLTFSCFLSVSIESLSRTSHFHIALIALFPFFRSCSQIRSFHLLKIMVCLRKMTGHLQRPGCRCVCHDCHDS